MLGKRPKIEVSSETKGGLTRGDNRRYDMVSYRAGDIGSKSGFAMGSVYAETTVYGKRPDPKAPIWEASWFASTDPHSSASKQERGLTKADAVKTVKARMNEMIDAVRAESK